ncbi:MAG: redoxin domain-containing protein [Halobacteriota archaeon]
MGGADRADGVSVGESIADVNAPLVLPNGGTVDRQLSDLLRTGPALVCFYTADFTPNCIEQWCALRDFDWFASTDEVQVVGISKSHSWIHRRFIDYLGLQFPLYTDRDLSIAEAFDVKYPLYGLVDRHKRSCFLVDENRRVRYKWVGDHWLDPSRDVPPISEICKGVRSVLGEPETELFGFDRSFT